jgi:Ca2+-binding RTX toxin-like protein
MLLTSWVRSFRQSLQNRRRGKRRGIDWQTQSLHGDAGRRSRNTEQLEDRMLLTAFVVDQQFVDANSGTINITNSTIDIDSDGTPEFDSIVFDDARISGVGGVGINVNLSDLVLTRIAFQGVQIGDQATGDNQTSGISITLNNVDLEAIAFDDTIVFSAFGGGVDINLTDVRMEQLAIFNSTITGGLNAGVTIDVASVSRNAVIDDLAISGSTIDGVALTAVGIQKSVIGASQANPVVITVPDHGLQTGAEVKITGVSGLTSANTRDTITVIDENTFELDNTDGSGDPPYGGGGTLTTTTDLNNIRIVRSNITGSTGLDGLAISLTDARAPGLTIQDNESIDSLDLSLTRTPMDGLHIRNNEAINANRPQVNAVNFELDNSTLTNVIIDGNLIDRGASASGGEGVVFTSVDSNVYGSFSNNVVQNTLGAGLKFVGTASAGFLAANRGPLVFDFSSLFAETSLTSAITADATTLQVVDGRAFQSQQVIVIENEHLFVESVSGNTLTVRRGDRGTLALSHANGSRLRSVTSSASGVSRTISGNTFTANAGAGVAASLSSGAALNADLTGNSFLNNVGGGIDISVTDTNAVTTSVARGGISRTATALNVADASVFSNFNVPFDVTIGGEILTVTAISENTLTVVRGVKGTSAAFHATSDTVTSASGDGLNLTVGGDGANDGNLFDGNSSAAINVLLNDEAAGRVDIVGNTIINTSNGGGGAIATDEDGISISLTGTQVNDEATAVLRRSRIENNQIGVDAVTTLVSNVPIGSTVFQVTDGSDFAANNVILIDGEQRTIQSVNGNIITLTSATTALHFSGAVMLTTSGSNFGRGVDIFFDEQTAIEDLQITGNTIANSFDDGIRITREDDAITRTVNPVVGQTRSVTIASNTISNNGLNPTFEQLDAAGTQQFGAGVEIVARNGSLDQLDAELRSNTISRNARLNPTGVDPTDTNGINLRAEADAQLLVDLTDNVINFSEGDGLLLTTRENSSTDSRDIGGTLTKNVFAENGQNGIEVLGRFGIFNLLVVGLEGVDPVDGQELGNSFIRNDYNGINIRRGGNASIVGNDFFENGQSEPRFVAIGAATPNRTFLEDSAINGSGIHVANGDNDGSATGGSRFDRNVNLAIKQNTFESNRGMGIDINSYVNNTITATIRDNLVTQNENDGIEISGPIDVTMLGNFVDRNEGRGIDLLSFGNGTSTVRQSNYKIGDGQVAGRNTIVGNFEEGIYYTSSAEVQDQNLLSTNANSRLANGDENSMPAAILQIDTNLVSDNGINSSASGTGIVFWIGTSGDISSTFQAYQTALGTGTGLGSVGGVEDVTDIAISLTGLDGTTTPFGEAGLNSRTNARVVNNDFEGNFGDDFKVDSFVSTVNPPTTGGVWNAPSVPPYSLNSYTPDPLARLNLVFEGNDGNGLDVRNPAPFYANAEGVFKSRDGVAETPSGPFPNGGTRARDATRVPSRSLATFGSTGVQSPGTGSEPNGGPDAIYRIADIQPIDVGNGIFELQVTLNPEQGLAYGGVLPFVDGTTVQIGGVQSVNGTLHSANGVYNVVNVNPTARTFRLQNSAGEDGPAYLSGGVVVVNIDNFATTGPNNAPPFQYSGMGPTTFRIAQGFDTSGVSPTNEFSSGDNFDGGFNGDGTNGNTDWGIWTPNTTRNGVITDIVVAGPSTLQITSPNHGLTDRRLVTFSEINGIPSANGTFEVEVTGANTFTITGPGIVDGAYIDGGEWKTRDDSFPDPIAPTFPLSSIVDVSPDIRSTSAGVVTLEFTEPVTNLDVGDLFLTRDGVPLDISGLAIQQTSPTQFTIDLTTVTAAEGQYQLRIDNAFPEATIVPVSPDPRVESVGVVTVNFTEDVTGVDISDFVLSVDRGDSNGFQAIDLSEIGANLAVTQISPSQYSVDLTSVSNDPGTYRLTLLTPRTVTFEGISAPGGVGTSVIVNSLDHGLSTGQTVTLAGVIGSANGFNSIVNGTYRIVVVDPDNFILFDDTLTNPIGSDETTFTTARNPTWTFDPEIIDRVGKAFSVDVFNVIADATEVWTRANTAPTADIIDISPDPRNSSVPSVIVQFSEPVNALQFTHTDLRLSRDVGQGFINVPLSAAQNPVPLDADANGFASRFRIPNVDVVTNIDGNYRLTLITTDTSRISDEQGSFLAFPVSDDWTRISTGPAPTITNVFPDPRQNAVGVVQISFSEPISNVDTANADMHFTLTRDTGDGNGPQVVPLVDPATNMALPLLVIDPSTLSLDLSTVTGDVGGSIDGNYVLTLNRGSGITAVSDGEALAVDAVEGWLQDSTSPTADILDIDPAPRVDDAGIVTVVFSESVTGVDLQNAASDFTLTLDSRDGNGPQTVPLNGVRVRPVAPVEFDGTPVSDPFSFVGNIFTDTYVIDLSDLTDAAGDYVLSTIATGAVADRTGNVLQITGSSTDSWTRIANPITNRINDLVFPGNPVPPYRFAPEIPNPVVNEAVESFFVDATPPQVVPVNVTPDPRSTAVGILTIDFTEPVVGFNLTDLVLTRDAGGGPQAVSLNGLTLNQITQSRYTIDLNLKTGAPGDYVLGIQGAGSLIEDLAGNPIQAGFIAIDSWTVENIGPSATVSVTPDPRTTPANAVQVSFTKEVAVAQVDVSDFKLERNTGSGFTEIVLTGASISADSPSMGFDDSFTLDLSFAGLTDVEATYRVTLVAADSGIVDRAGIELSADAFDVWVLDNTSPTVDIVDIAPDPRQSEVGTVNIIFNEGVTGVDINDFMLLRDTGTGLMPVSLSGLTVSQQTALRYTIDLSTVTTVDEATYEIRLVTTDGVSPVTDLAGNPLQVDGSLGVADTAALDSWFRGVDVVDPSVSISTVTTPRANAAGVVTFTFSEDVSGVDIGDVELTLDTGSGAMPVDISGLTVTAAPGSATQYLLDLSSVTVTQGTYVLRVVTTDIATPVVDAAGNSLDPTFGVGVADQISFVVQTIDPSAVITPVSPDPRLRDAGLVTVTFSQPVQGVDISDFSLTRDTGIGPQPVSLQSVTVIQDPSGSGADQYVIDLTSVTGSDGNYVLTLNAEGSGITAIATGDPMTSDAIESWSTITTITVNTTNDTVDVNPGDGIVADAGGNVSLRAAIMEANALVGDDRIVVPAGVYALTLPGAGGNVSSAGDLDITETTGALTIVGAGAGLTIIDARSLERVFHILGGATLNLEGVTVTGGLVTGSEDGGGVRNDGGTVSIVDSVITGNVSQDDAGGINNTGNLTLTRVTVSNNSAARTGGGIRNAGNLVINASTIGGTSNPADPLAPDLRNTSVLAGGGIVNLGTGILTINNSTIAGNVASSSAAQGAGLYSIGTASLTNVTIAENEAGGQGGGLAVAGGTTSLLNTLIGDNNSVTTTANDVFESTNNAMLIVTRGNNLVENRTGATAAFPAPAVAGQPNVNGDLVGVSPQLGRLADNGGPTLTVAVMPGSPAIDAAADTADATDQRGIIRGLDNFSVANAGQLGIDIGAYETGGFFVNSLADTIDVNPGDGIAVDQFGNTTLRAAIMEANASPGDSTIILADGIHELSLIELDETAPTADIVDVSPDPLSAESTGLDPVDEITVNFSEPIQGLDLTNAETDFTLTLNNGTTTSVVPLTGVTIRKNSDTQYVLEGLTTLLAADGLYTLQLDTSPVTPNITDFALTPNGLAADPSDLTGMIAAVDTFVRGADVFAPTAVISDITTPRSTNPGLVTVTFDEPVFGVDLSSDPANFTLLFDDGILPAQTVSLASVSVQQVTSSVYTLDLSTVLAFNNLTDVGTYTLTFDGTATTIFDFSANAFAGAPLVEVWTVAADTVAPSADFVPVSPNPRIGAVGVVTVNFTEDVTGVDLTDAETDFDLFFDVDGPGGIAPVQVSLVDAMNNPLVVTQVSDSEYTIDFTDVTAADGQYTLVLTTDGMIVDGVDNPLASTVRAGVTAEEIWLTGDSLETDARAGAFGDLDIRDASLGGKLTIIGSGEGVSIIDGNSIDRVFDVQTGSRLQLQNLTVTGGQVVGDKDGAGIRSEGLVVLSGAEITGNSADGNGGAVYTASTASTTTLSVDVSLTATTVSVANAAALGTAVPGFVILVGSEQMLVTGIAGNNLTVVRGANTSTPAAHTANEMVSLLHLSVSESTLSSNSADFGAGIFVDDGTVAIVGSTLQSNMATTDGGAIYIDQAASVNVTGSTVRSNSAGRDGGGFYNNATAELTITDATVSGNSAVRDGGGLFNEIVASATLLNARFSANSATNGGGIHNQDGVVSVSGGSLIANTATEDGGGVFTSSSATTSLANTTLSGNTAARDGGGVRNDGTMTVTSVSLAGNSAGRDGGAIYNDRTLTVTQSMFTGNTAAGSGGALDLNSIGVVSLMSSTLRGNTATVNGGAISNNGASRLTLSEMTVDGNQATGNGGGLFHNSSVVATVSGTTISNNSAANGGGVSSAGAINLTNATISSNVATSNGGGLHNTSTATLLGVTIANNMATGSGGGISSNNAGGNASLKNTLVARNTATTNGDVNGTAFLNQGNNLIGDRGSVTTFVNGINGNLVGTTGAEIDPLLSPLQDNGGATLTHALLFGSPARDNGNNVGVPAFDQRGFDRRFDGDGDGNVTVDIGAFESGLTVNSFLDTVDVNPGERSSADEDGNSTLRAAIMEANALPGADTIVLLPGTYRLTIAGQDENDARSGDLDITESLTIIGAGDGSTIIDAAGLDRAFHIIAGASLDLKGVTIINGDATLGGAVLNQGTFSTENVTISGSSAVFGGAIYNDIVEDELVANITVGAGTLQVRDVSVFPRQAGFVIQIGTEQIRVDSISGNTFTVTRGFNLTTATTHAAEDVVTVVATSVVSLLNTTVTGNSALLNGGAIFNNDTVNITLSSVNGNAAGVRGGGLYNTQTATLDRATFDGNRAEVRGGAIFNEGTTLSSPSTVTIDASTLSNNVSGARGGAVFNSQTLTLLNSTVSANVAGGEGGGIFNTGPDGASSGTTTIVNSTVTANSSDLSAGGIFNNTGSVVLLTNSIVAGNDAQASNNDVQGAFSSVRTNFIGDAGTSTGLVNGQNGNLVGTTLSPIDPVLGVLASNGGPTQTHELLIGSPAIDAGDNSGGETVDQRGGRRPTDQTADIGAFEVQANNLSIDNVSMNEGSSGSTLFVFTVLLESVAADPVTVSYGTVQNTAQQGSDFIGTAGTLVFAPGELSKTITVEVNGDTTTESTEQFFVQLFNPVNALLSNDRGTGTILNDDAVVTFADVDIVEGDSGTSTATFNVVLSNPTSADITLGYQTSAGTATEGSAALGGDYVEASGTLTFLAGETSKSFTVTINGDTDVEAFETIFADLTLTSGSVQLPDSQAIGTIQNDDIAFADISSPSVTELTGSNNTVSFTVALTQLNAFDVTVQVQTVDGTATAGNDYVALPPTTVTIPAGMLSVTQNVTVIGDTDFEGGATGTPETFNLEYVASTITRDGVASSGTLGNAGTASITDDELPPTVWVIRVTGAGTQGELLRDGTDDGVFNPLFVRNFALTANTETVNGDPGTQNDRFIVDFVNGNPIPDGGLIIDGGDETSGDSLEIVDSDLATPFVFDSVVYTSTGVDSGTVLIVDGAATPLTRTITYAELEPVLDTVAAVNRTFTINSVANPGDHVIDVANAGGRTIISDDGTSAFESVEFANPTTSLTLNAGDGNNTITVGALDAGFAASFTINAEDGDDDLDATATNIALSIVGGDGADRLLGGNLADTIDGGLGNDTIDGGAGNDSLAGGADNDMVSGGAGTDSIDGGVGNDSILGGADGDTLIGGDDDDTILGEDGNDSIFGGNGSDNLDGGAGNDTIVGESGGDSIVGGSGQDSLDGGGDADTLDGGDDNDTVIGGSGTDIVAGGDGDDSVDGGSDNDTLSGGGGTDILVGGSGDDQVAEVAVDAESITLTDTTLTVGGLADAISGVEEFILTGGDLSSLIDASQYTLGNVTLNGAGGDDTLIGSDGDDFINGGGGNDTLSGGLGNDSMLGGAGNDVIDGGSANDTLAGNSGNDTLNGGTGLDSIDGGANNDVIDGGDDNDTVLGGSGADSINGGLGNDRLLGESQDDTINGDDGDDTLIGGTGGDVLRGGAGIDNLNGQSGRDDLDGGADDDTVFGGAGQDTLTGGQGIDNLDGQGSSFDTIRLVGTTADDVFTLDRSNNFNQLRKTSGTTYGVNFKRTETIEINTLDGNDTITVIGDLLGSDGDAAFVIDFGNGNNLLDASLNTDAGKTFIVTAGTGKDTLKGSAGADNLNGGSGDDSIDGGAGEDTLTGGAGADILNGGTGADLISGGTENDTISGGSEADTLTAGTGNDSVRGGDGDDVILGEDGNDLLYGDAGNDSILGGRDDDSIDGGDNDDTIFGERGFDVIKGGNGNDSIVGGDHNDTIDGGNGNDLVNGNLGNDVLLGGADNDTVLGGSDADTLLGGTGADDIRGQGSSGDKLVGETGLAGTADDTPDPGDTFDDVAEIDNAFVLDTAILDTLNSF